MEAKPIEGGIYTDKSCFTVVDSTITEYTCDYTEVIIPYSINGVTITAIGDYAFGQTGIESVKIPSSVTIIGGFAFAQIIFGC